MNSRTLPDLETQMDERRRERAAQPEWIDRQPLWLQFAVMLGIALVVAVGFSGLLWLTIRRW